MKKELLKKVIKGTSIALLLGGMIGGTGLISNNNASANGVPGLTVYQQEHLNNRDAEIISHVYNNAYDKTHSDKAAARSVHQAYVKLSHKSKSTKRSHLLRNRKATKRTYKKSVKRNHYIRRHSTKKNARRAYRYGYNKRTGFYGPYFVKTSRYVKAGHSINGKANRGIKVELKSSLHGKVLDRTNADDDGNFSLNVPNRYTKRNTVAVVMAQHGIFHPYRSINIIK